MKIWDVASGTLARTLPATAPVTSSPDGKRLATGYRASRPDGAEAIEWQVARLWDPVRGRLLRSVDVHAGPVAFTADLTTVATGNQPVGEYGIERFGEARLWRLHAGRLLRTMTGDRAAVAQLAFSPDGEILAAGTSRSEPSVSVPEVKLWRVHDGGLRATIRPPGTDITALVFSSDGRSLAVGGMTYGPAATGRSEADYYHLPGEIAVCDVRSARIVRSLEISSAWPGALCFSPDGEMLAAATSDGRLLVWDLGGHQTLTTRRAPFGSSLHPRDREAVPISALTQRLDPGSPSAPSRPAPIVRLAHSAAHCVGTRAGPDTTTRRNEADSPAAASLAVDRKGKTPDGTSLLSAREGGFRRV